MNTIIKNKNQESIQCKKKIEPTTDLVTEEDVDIVIKRALGSPFKVVGYNVTAFSDEKLGFLGCHRKLTVTVKTDTSSTKETHQFFVKSIPYDIEIQTDVINECKVFYKETLCYKELIPELLRGLKDKSWIAESYLVKDNMLILEDLRSKNFKLQGKLLDFTYAKSAVTCIANLHASSLLAEKRLGKTMPEIYPDLLQENFFIRDKSIYRVIKSSIKLAVAIVGKMGLDNTYVEALMDSIFEKILPSKTRQNVVNHGDTKSVNIMFNDSKPSPKSIMIDYQLLRYAPPSIDISALFYMSLSRKLREKHEEELLKHYHDTLTKIVKSNNNEVELLTFSELLEEYQELKVIGLIAAAIICPISLIEGKLCAELTKTSEGFASIVLGDRMNFVLELMDKDSEYNEILLEIFTELAEKSKQ